MSFTIDLEIRTCEENAKRIFAKEYISDADAELGAFYIRKWKQLTGWVEQSEFPIKLT